MSENNTEQSISDDPMAASWAGVPDAGNRMKTQDDPVPPATFASFAAGTAPGAANDIAMVLDIPVQVTVELGRKRMSIKQVLQLAQGSVVELDAHAGDPMDVLVNGYLVARGEVVVVNDKFGVRLTDIITPNERMRRLGKAG